MGTLLKIKSAGFSVSVVDAFIEISHAGLLTLKQREFLQVHKSEIISLLQDGQLRTNNSDAEFIKCRDYPNFQNFNQHGGDDGISNAGVQLLCWSDTQHLSEKFDPAIVWVELPPQFPANALKVTCYKLADKAIQVEATSAQHAEFLRQMNPNRSYDNA